MPAHFENDEKRDDRKIRASVHTIPANDKNLVVIISVQFLQEVDVKEMSLHLKNRLVSF